MITQAEEDVPFDLQQWRYIKYVSSSQGLKQFEVSLEDAISNLSKRNDDKDDDFDIPSRVDDIPF